MSNIRFLGLFLSALLLCLNSKAETIRVGILINDAETRFKYKSIAYPFLINKDVELKALQSTDIVSGGLSKIDVLCVSTFTQSNSEYDVLSINLNTQGFTEIRNFIANGGTYIGQGAGARLALDKEARGIAEGSLNYISARRFSNEALFK